MQNIFIERKSAGFSLLSALTNLTYLNLINNQISDISVISGLTNLTLLNLSTNQISDIQPLVDNSGITGSDDYIDIRFNLLDSGDCANIDTLISRDVNVEHDVTCP